MAARVLPAGRNRAGIGLRVRPRDANNRAHGNHHDRSGACRDDGAAAGIDHHDHDADAIADAIVSPLRGGAQRGELSPARLSTVRGFRSRLSMA